MNSVAIMGRLARDPELRQTPNGTSVARFSVAVPRRFAKEGQQQADFIDCIAWRQTAEFVSKYFQKGNMIAVTGSIQTRNWDDSEGKKRYATEVIADNVDFTGEKASGQQDGQTPTPPQPQYDSSSFGEYSENDEDLPF